MYRDRVYETSTSTGTGTFTMAGAVAGYRTFTTAFSTNSAYYLITNQSDATQWEIGSFTVSGETLTRTAAKVLMGSAGASTLVNFSAGTKNVYNVAPSAAVLNWCTTASGTVATYGAHPSYSSLALTYSPATVHLSGVANCDCACNCCCGGGGD